MPTSKQTISSHVRSDTNITNRRQLLFKDITNVIRTASLEEYVQSIVGQNERVRSTSVAADHNPTKGTRTLLVTLRDPRNVDYFMSLRPHIIQNISVFVMRSIPNEYPLYDVRTEYCLITKTDDGSGKVDAESVRRFVSNFGTIKTLENVNHEFLIQFEDYDSVDKLIMNGERNMIDGLRVRVKKTQQRSVSYETMVYLTITFNQYDETLLQTKLIELIKPWRPISNKKCLSIIPGLVSYSFQVIDNVRPKTFQSLFSDMPVWIKQGLKVAEESDVHVSDKDGHLLEISFGYLQSNRIYAWHKKITDGSLLTWKTNVTQNYIAIEYQKEPLMQLRFTSDCLDRYFIISTTYPGVYMMILPLTAPPKCYDVLSLNGSITHSRKLNFDVFDESCLSDSSAISLRFANESSLYNFADTIERVMRLDRHQGYIECVAMSSPKSDKCDHYLLDFWSSYAYQALLSLGHRIKHRITWQTFQKIRADSHASRNEQYSNHSCYLKLMAIYHRAHQNRFFDINQEYDRVLPIPPSTVLDTYIYVPRVYLTPYGVFPLPVKPMRGNRILRQKDCFGPCENFCRVILRDIDLGPARDEFIKINEQWIKNLIVGKKHLYVGDRQFQFLLCSNSQLKDRSFWFHSPYFGCTVDNIRQWMGDFSRETCIGTYIARMALTLTSTTASITLTDDQMELINDKKDDQGRIFTDGTGKISPDALRQALIAYRPDLADDAYAPCVIQTRLNGLKGVFVKAPDLKDRGVLIQYRPSQYKFDVKHNVLEIVKHSRSGTAFLNRQIIVLLENMGVKTRTFIQLQNQVRLNISMSLLGNKTAERILKQHAEYYDWQRIRSAGIQLGNDPFSRSLLLSHTLERLKGLKEKSNVPVSESDGRILVGVVDETNSLQYGQIFIQFRQLNGENRIIHSCQVLITKNPAHFPGDVLKLDAVNCPALYHLSECVVFPTQGPRPHPNEISGSDTDGDEYWVCWNKDLVRNAIKQYDPALFDAPEKSKHNGPITIDVIADFLFKYLSSDSLGRLSNRHLAFCALYGPNDERSCRLARIISDAVDFPKTGVPPKVSNDMKVSEYPVFMEVRNKPSRLCQSSLELMYQQVKEVWDIHSKWIEMIDEEQIQVHSNFLIPGYQQYIPQATKDYQYYTSRIDSILLMYNLTNEYELITGCHSYVNEELKNNDSIETSLLEFQYLQREMRQRFAADQLNYEEQKKKASAWYYVAYQAHTKLSFAWIMNQLMCDIAPNQQIVQDDEQLLQIIGQSLYDQGFDVKVKQYAGFYHLTNEKKKDCFQAIILGEQFLKIIELANQSETNQEIAHEYLIILHRISLNNVWRMSSTD